MVNRRFWLGMLVMVLAFSVALAGCDNGTTDTDGGNSGGGGGNNGGNGGGNNGGNGTGLAGTFWNGRVETPSTFSLTVSNSTIRWKQDRRYATDLTLEDGTFTNGQSLAGTKWSGNFGNAEIPPLNMFLMTLTFIDETTAKPSWEPFDYMTYTLDGDTINFEYMRVREGTLAFKENSGFQFNDRNTLATGTYSAAGGVITLDGVWQKGDSVGTDREKFEVSGSLDSSTIELAGGHFWGIKKFNKEAEPWYPKEN